MSTPPDGRTDLDALRARIEQVDRKLVELVSERQDLARRIGEHKQAVGLPTLDPRREAAVLRRASELAAELDLPPEDVRDLFWVLIGLSRRQQQADRGRPSPD